MSAQFDLNAIYVASKVAEHASFVRASKELQTPLTTVSAKVQKLEQSLGVKLFRRSTRRVSITEAGEIFFQHARRGTDAFHDAVAAVSFLAERPKGMLRVAAPLLFTQKLLPQILPRFFQQYPELRLSVETVNTLPDLAKIGADLGIGVGPSRRSGYTLRRLFYFSQAIYASPQFTARFGLPQNVADLAQYELLGLANGRVVIQWELVDNSQTYKLEFDAFVSISDVSAIHSMALAGLGIALLPEQMCKDDLAAGRLIRLLPKVGTPPVSVYVFYPTKALLPVKVKVFADYLAECFPSG